MSTPANRQLFSSPRLRQIPDLLQSIMAAELLAPSKHFWLVSPWVSDIPLLDNEAGSFATFEPEWPLSRIRLSQALNCLAESGTQITVVTRDVEHNRHFYNAAVSTVSADRLRFLFSEELHAKGILGDHFYLSGSMNFTYNGIYANTEILHLITDPRLVAEAHLAMRERWG
jgi:phosphatidylserine/phosphatidylglycerophosphate/cardiolipin synthase-like enzyme